ncbi:MAG: Mrp/NBP35 family ATP-binding protein [Spirochaetales bacterium]|jgi:Mrp family chromosome partitioning ATPase|nr:Mrp/NBP35 family ATP-binding protein [Spirochaetales bacterium]
MADTCNSNKEKERQEQDKRIAEQLSQIKHTFLVMSGKGGVGKSTIAVNLAVALADRGYSVGLMDVDLHGPSTIKMLGLEGEHVKMAGQHLMPIPYSEKLKVVSMAALLEDRDMAVIWRGPLKIGAIKQFISDVLWGELDYLFIDSPPGTGDEPLTVAQVVPKARGIIVTTPQEISLLDIRKSITFCRQVNMPVVGILENMSGLSCPHCGERIDLFSSGGGERTAVEMGVPFLGKIPIRPEIVASTDEGQPYVLRDGKAKEDFKIILDILVQGGKEE